MLNYSHVDVLQLNANTETIIGVTELEELDPADENAPDYNGLEPTGNRTATVYTAAGIETIAINKDGKESKINIDPENISQKVDQAEFNQTASKLEQKVGGTSVVVADKKITIGQRERDRTACAGK